MVIVVLISRKKKKKVLVSMCALSLFFCNVTERVRTEIKFFGQCNLMKPYNPLKQ